MTDIEYLKKYLPKEKLKEALERLKKGEPVQYIVGHTNFYGNHIEVDKNVLIPRFETEELVEYTLEYIRKIFHKKVKIVDLGTGSGCIAITLKKKISCDVTAIDISKHALNVAKRNAEKNQVSIDFVENNMLDHINQKFDVVISNPPYIARDEKIMDIVKNNEPHIALYADHQGLYYYEKILSQVKNNINKPFLIAFEIGYKQGKEILKLARKEFKTEQIIIKKDLQHKDRFLFIFSK